MNAQRNGLFWCNNCWILWHLRRGHVISAIQAWSKEEVRIEAADSNAAQDKHLMLLGSEDGGSAAERQLNSTPEQHLASFLALGSSRSHDLCAPLLAKAIIKASKANIVKVFHTSDSPRVRLSRVSSCVFPAWPFPARPGARGGDSFFRPAGWLRYAIDIKDSHLYQDWCVCYHGTAVANILPVLLHGLRRPGEYGVVMAHGHAASAFMPLCIYFSPSIEYAGHPVYAQFFRLGPKHWGQVVLQCRVHPASIVEIPSTLGNAHWPTDVRMDPNFPSNNCMEWLIQDPADVIVSGLMVREFGQDIDQHVYGSTAQEVSDSIPEAFSWPCRSGPEYAWTRLRSDLFRSCNLFVAQ